MAALPRGLPPDSAGEPRSPPPAPPPSPAETPPPTHTPPALQPGSPAGQARRGEAAAARRPCTAAEGSRQLRQRVRILPGRALAPPPLPRHLPARRPAPPLPERGNHSPGSAGGAARSHGPPGTERHGTARPPPPRRGPPRGRRGRQPSGGGTFCGHAWNRRAPPLPPPDPAAARSRPTQRPTRGTEGPRERTLSRRGSLPLLLCSRVWG